MEHSPPPSTPSGLGIADAPAMPPSPTPAPEASVTHPASAIPSMIQTTGRPPWLHTHVRNLILLAITGTVVYLAIIDVGEARSVITTTFTGLASYLFAERASLKIPGKSE